QTLVGQLHRRLVIPPFLPLARRLLEPFVRDAELRALPPEGCAKPVLLRHARIEAGEERGGAAVVRVIGFDRGIEKPAGPTELGGRGDGISSRPDANGARAA